jgi:hypothetical protein
MSVRTAVLAVVLAAILGAGAGAGAVVLTVKRGPVGPVGEEGPRGPRGPAGETAVSADEVQAAIDEDPSAVAASLSGLLDYQDNQQNLDPDPADVQSSLDDLCTELSFSEALSDTFLPC